MSPHRRGLLALGTGVVAAVTALATGVVVERKVVGLRRTGAIGSEGFGTLHSEPRTVMASDGVKLHVEVDEVAPHSVSSAPTRPGQVTVVLVHGYALSLDCWHFQRKAFRGRNRLVLYDQRSHGQSERSPQWNATIDQLAHDLKAVLDATTGEEPVVLVGHSMGGMTILAFAEHYAALFGSRVVGAALISTSAGGLRPHRTLTPWLPDRVMSALTPRVVASLARAPELVDSARHAGSNIGYLATERLAFGDVVPPSYIEFVNQMLDKTSFRVIAEFFPTFSALDKWAVLKAFEKIPTLILCGTADLLTSIEHSRKIAVRLPGARLVEAPGAGHMVILERSNQVTRVLKETVASAERLTAEQLGAPAGP